MKIRNTLIEYLYITIGAFILALASTLFFDKVGLVTGGATGIGIIIKSICGMPLWLSNLLINVPLLLVAILLEGKRIGIRTLYGTFILTVWLNVATYINIDITEDLLLISLFGGIIAGVGGGLVFKGFGTTGGTDILAIIIKHFMPYISLGNALNIIETLIVVSGIYFFSIEKALYAVISIYVYSKVTDLVMEGPKNGKVIYIISDKYEEISKAILDTLGRGVTAYDARGMYSNVKKEVLMCVVDKKQVPVVKKICNNIDDKSFIMTCDVREVLGEGFAKLDTQTL